MVVSNGATVQQRMGAAASAQARVSTIVARGQIDGVQCVDMLIDTGASCCFIRRSCAEANEVAAVSAEPVSYRHVGRQQDNSGDARGASKQYVCARQ